MCQCVCMCVYFIYLASLQHGLACVVYSVFYHELKFQCRELCLPSFCESWEDRGKGLENGFLGVSWRRLDILLIKRDGVRRGVLVVLFFNAEC